VGAIQAPTRWVTRLIPVFLAAGVAFSTYVFAKRICSMRLLPRPTA